MARPLPAALDLGLERSGRATLLATIPLAAVLDALTIEQLVVVSLLSGVARVFFDVGYLSYVPAVIGRGNVLAGNSTMQTLRSGGQIAGPGLGGWLVATIGAAQVVVVQAATFLVSAACLGAIGTREPPVIPPSEAPRLRAQIVEGLAFVACTRVLRATAIASAASNFSFATASAVTFIFMSRTLDLSPTVIGLIVAAGSVTVLLGAALTPALSRRIGSARIIWLSLAITGPVTLLGPFARPGSLVVLLVVSAAAGELGQIVYAITNVSLRQRFCPDRMLGRVNATMQFLIMGLWPLGAVLGGVLGEVLGLRGTLWVSAAIAILGVVPLFRALRTATNVEDLPRWHDESD